VEAFEERLYAAVEGVEAEAEDHVGLGAEAVGLEEAPDGVGAHELSAVEEGEAFLALEFDRLPAFGLIDLVGGATAAFPIDFAHAKDGREHEVGEGAEVAAGAKAALLVDNREDIVVEAVDETLDGLELCAAVAEAEVLGLEEEHETDDVLGHFVADAAGVAHDEVFLELAELLFADADVAEAAEAGGDAVDGDLLVFHLLVEVVAALLDAAGGLVAEGEGHVVVYDFLDASDGQGSFGGDMVDHLKNIKIVRE
jgi:hypothetical protein